MLGIAEAVHQRSPTSCLQITHCNPPVSFQPLNVHPWSCTGEKHPLLLAGCVLIHKVRWWPAFQRGRVVPTTTVIISPYTDVSVLVLIVCFLLGWGADRRMVNKKSLETVLILRTEADLIRRILRFWTKKKKKLEMTGNQPGEYIQWQLICGCSGECRKIQSSPWIKSSGIRVRQNQVLKSHSYLTSVSLSLLIC